MTFSWQHMTYKLSKQSQTDLVFGLWSELISRCVRAGVQVSTCRGCALRHLVNTQKDTRTHRRLSVHAGVQVSTCRGCALRHMVNTQTDTRTHRRLSADYTISSASCAKNFRFTKQQSAVFTFFHKFAVNYKVYTVDGNMQITCMQNK